MKQLKSSIARPLIKWAYLMPALTCLVTLLWACIPHLYFLYGGAAYETMSPFHLLGNAWEQSQRFLGEDRTVLANELFFAYAMIASVVIGWLAILWHALTSFSTAACALYAFSKEPTDKRSNVAKRLLQFVCPNRPCYVIFNLLPLVLAAFPYFLTYCYRENLWMDMTVCYFGPPDLLLSGILVLLSLASYLLTLKAQAREHLDMFRLYKGK